MPNRLPSDPSPSRIPVFVPPLTCQHGGTCTSADPFGCWHKDSVRPVDNGKGRLCCDCGPCHEAKLIVPVRAVASDRQPADFKIEAWNAEGVTIVASAFARYRFAHREGFPFLYALSASEAVIEPAKASIERARTFLETHYAATDGKRSAPRRAA